MDEGEHHFRLEPADSRGSRNNNRGLVKVGPSELLHDRRLHHIMVSEQGEFVLVEPPPRRILPMILIGLGVLAFLGVLALFLIDYINLKLAKPAPIPVVVTVQAPESGPPVLGSTQAGTTPLRAPLPALPSPMPAAMNGQTISTQQAQPEASASPSPTAAPNNRQIPLSRGFGEVKDDDGSSKYLVRPFGD